MYLILWNIRYIIKEKTKIKVSLKATLSYKTYFKENHKKGLVETTLITANDFDNLIHFCKLQGATIVSCKLFRVLEVFI